MFQQKLGKSGRKTIDHEPVHVGKKNLTLRVGIKPATRQSSTMIIILTPRVRYLYPTWTLMVDCYNLTHVILPRLSCEGCTLVVLVVK